MCLHLWSWYNIEADHALGVEGLDAMPFWGLFQPVFHCSSAPLVRQTLPLQSYCPNASQAGVFTKTKPCSDDVPADCPGVLYNQLNYRIDK